MTNYIASDLQPAETSNALHDLWAMEIKEVIGMRAIVPVADGSGWVMGLIRHRNRQIPLMDLRMLPFLGGNEFSEQTCIVIAELESSAGTRRLGFLVDTINDAYELARGKQNN